MSRQNSNDNTTPETAAEITDYDVVILNHADLDEFMHRIGAENVPKNVTILTEDTHTQNTVKFNLVTTHNTEYKVVTQLHHPVSSDDEILDIRTTHTSFADYLIGL